MVFLFCLSSSILLSLVALHSKGVSTCAFCDQHTQAADSLLFPTCPEPFSGPAVLACDFQAEVAAAAVPPAGAPAALAWNLVQQGGPIDLLEPDSGSVSERSYAYSVLQPSPAEHTLLRQQVRPSGPNTAVPLVSST